MSWNENRIFFGLIMQIIAILFISEGGNTKSVSLVGVGVALFSFGYFLLHDSKKEGGLNEV